MCKTLGFAIALLAATAVSSLSRAAVIYTTIGSTYAQNFDGLPVDMPSNASIETVYTNGWEDDNNTVAGDKVSLPGWYLWHNISPASENGSNGYQRMRVGPGANTGAFWLFGASAADPEKALGSVGSTTVAGNGLEMFMALRVTNNTGVTLDSITVTFDGEQWRDGQAATGETLNFAYNVGATTANGPTTPDWATTATFTAVPTLNFTSPTVGGTGSSGTAVDGNASGNRIAGITATVSGVNWQSGADLWLRWGDHQLASAADDGVAIDNFSFSATVPEPTATGLTIFSILGLVFGRARQVRQF
jgi:hypothetical protein